MPCSPVTVYVKSYIPTGVEEKSTFVGSEISAPLEFVSIHVPPISGTPPRVVIKSIGVLAPIQYVAVPSSPASGLSKTVAVMVADLSGQVPLAAIVYVKS